MLVTSCIPDQIFKHQYFKFIFKDNVQFIFVTRFGDKVSHLLINKDVCATPIVFQSQATVQCKLHSIDPEIFPLLETTDIPVSICYSL